MNRRAVGVDLGTKRIGIAICDNGGLVATPHETIKRVGDEVVEHGRIIELAHQIEASTVVVGLPIDLDGDHGPAARAITSEVRRLTKKFAKAGSPVKVELQDERLSTVTANKSLAHMTVRRDRRKEMVDQLAAATILQTWLDGQG